MISSLSKILLFIFLLFITGVISTLSDENSDSQIPFPLNYGMQVTGKISTSFDCYGGYGGVQSTLIPQWPSSKFETPSGSQIDYLYGGTIFIGGVVGGDTLVSSGRYAQNYYYTMTPANSEPSVNFFDYCSDFSMRAKYNDTLYKLPDYNIMPMNLVISQRSHAFYEVPFSKSIIYDMVITNIGNEEIKDGYIGFFFDNDIYHQEKPSSFGVTDDIVGSLRDEGIFYAMDNDGDPVDGIYNNQSPRQLFAFKFLNTSFETTDTNFNWWLNSIDFSNGELGPRKKFDWIDTTIISETDTIFDTVLNQYTYPFYNNEIDRYKMLSIDEWDYNQVFTASINENDSVWMFPNPLFSRSISNGKDIRMMISVGKFDLPPDSSIRLQYALFTGEIVHWKPDNFLSNLFHNYRPDEYLYNVNFSDVSNIAFWANYLADSLLNVSYAPIGLEMVEVNSDSIILEWDPWVFPGVENVNIYLTELSNDLLPYPGIAAPWLVPESLYFYGTTSKKYQHIFDNLENDKFYFANIAYKTEGGESEISKPLIINLQKNIPAPLIQKNIRIIEPGEAPNFEWEELSNENIDHYNIYKFQDSTLSKLRYHRFYNTESMVDGITPLDTFIFENNTYYYYAMEPYLLLDSGNFIFEDNDYTEGEVYIVTSVNKNGFESEFSNEVYISELSNMMNKDILVVTSSGMDNDNFVVFDSIASFYDSILGLTSPAYSYDMYNFSDTINSPVSEFSWEQLLNYKLVIIDDGLREKDIISISNPSHLDAFSKYLIVGGKLAYFGGFRGITELHMNSEFVSGTYPLDNWFVNNYFAVDSLFHVDLVYFLQNGYDKIDTSFGFTYASSMTANFLNIGYTPDHNPFKDNISTFWNLETNPAVVSFMITDDAQVIYTYGSKYPNTSILEGKPVGVHTFRDFTETFLFGFHLWTMDYDESRRLIDDMMSALDIQLFQNINNSDLSNLTLMVDYLYRGMPLSENLLSKDCDKNGLINVIDLVSLIDKSF
ncbi:MAG: hypothetical protein DRP35_00015 [Candidatus Zixiibacteriota bacterium]|nr:MAG: hypothetical protein DRP35_00015 [candidate division Zixibacteria bacterium]